MNHDDSRPAAVDDAGECHAALRRALAAADLSAPAAAFAVAAAVGRCELLGVWPRPARGTLSADVATAAAEELRRRLEQLTAVAGRLARGGGTVAAAVRLLDDRVLAWSAFVAIDDVALDDPAAVVLGPVLDATETCEAAMAPLEPLLVRAARADGRVRRWRAALASPYRELPPWWLADGSVHR